MNEKILLKPQKLNAGDTIGIISPSGAIKEEKLWDSSVHFFENKGYKVKIAPHARDIKAYLAGSDENRASDLMDFFEDDKVKAIICSRGGYGVYRILDKIGYEKIINNPKIFVGYSDITALLLAFYKKAGLVTFPWSSCSSKFWKRQSKQFH